MNRFRKITTAIVFVLAVIATQFGTTAPANAAATRTWDGEGGDGKFSTAKNWDGDTPLAEGDAIELPYVQNSTEQIKITADVTIRFSAAIIIWQYDVSGEIHFQDNATFSPSNSDSLKNTVINAAGDLTLRDVFSNPGNPQSGFCSPVDHNSFATFKAGSIINGVLTLFGGQIYTKDLPSGITKIILGYSIWKPSDTYTTAEGHRLVVNSDLTLPIDVLAAPADANEVINPYVIARSSTTCASEQNVYEAATRTVSGPITLNNDVTAEVAENVILNLTGTITKNNFEIGMEGKGKMNVGGKEIAVEEKTVDLTGDQPDKYEEIPLRTTTTLKDAVRGDISVRGGGTFKGSGTVKSLYVDSGGATIPSRITVKRSLNLRSGSTYVVEITDKNNHGQLTAGDKEDTSSSIYIYNAILDVQLLDNHKIYKGDTLTIIKNNSDKEVEGTFKDLPEGAKIKAGDAEFQITYKGGESKNDVVLTALNGENPPAAGDLSDAAAAAAKTDDTAPSAPDTGIVNFVLKNPAIVLLIGLFVAIMVLSARKKTAKSATRR